MVPPLWVAVLYAWSTMSDADRAALSVARDEDELLLAVMVRRTWKALALKEDT